MNRIRICIIIFLLPFCTIRSQKIIHAKDFGLTENTDATPVILAALQECRKAEAEKFIIPEGTFHFYPERAYEKYCAVANHDNGLKRIGFPLTGLNNLEIDANNAKFIFHGYMVPFVIEDSRHIRLRNFSIDWDKQFHLQGEVIKVDTGKNCFQLRISGLIRSPKQQYMMYPVIKSIHGIRIFS